MGDCYGKDVPNCRGFVTSLPYILLECVYIYMYVFRAMFDVRCVFRDDLFLISENRFSLIGIL